LDETISASEVKIKDYSKHGDLDDYLTGIIGEKFHEYRHKWNEASRLRKTPTFPIFLVFETMFKCQPGMHHVYSIERRKI